MGHKNPRSMLIGVATPAFALAILAGLGAPSMLGFVQKSQVRGASETLFEDLTYARTEAFRRNRLIVFSASAGTNWCYGLNVGAPCDCTSGDSCNIKSVSGKDFSGTAMAAGFDTLTFDPAQGTITGTGGTMGDSLLTFSNAWGTGGVKPMRVSLRLCTAHPGSMSC